MEYFTIAWNSLEGLVAVVAGALAGSISLVGFGIDSFIEVASRDRRTEIPLTNFRGIELRDFPAEVARLALIIAEFQCDVLYRGQKEALAEFLPLDAQNWITCGNALRIVSSVRQGTPSAHSQK